MKNKFRIFCAIPSSANNFALKSSNIWYKNLVEPLIDMGHEIVMPSFDVSEQYRATYDHGSEKQQQAKIEYGRRLVKDVKESLANKHIDFILTYYDSFQISPEAIDELRQTGSLVVNYSCNNIHQFDEVREVAPHFDFCIVPEKEAIEKYLAVGAKPLHIQMAANPQFYKPYAVKEKYNATFVGQKYLNRPEYIHYLRKKGIDAKVWGPGWRPLTPLWNRGNFMKSLRHLPGRIWLRFNQIIEWRNLLRTDPYALPPNACGGTLSDIDMVKMYSWSKISLNFSEVKDQITGEIKRHIRLRDFEAPMSGAFYMTAYQEELTEYYDIDKEIVCYDTKEELLDKVKYYLAHPNKRIRIREAGFQRARRDHTWEKRFEQLFSMLKLT